jgi:FdhD protein
MMQAKVKGQVTVKVSGADAESCPDLLAVEEPLEIRILYGPPEHRQEKSISVTMRTPGNDSELIAGFLFTENIISSSLDLIGVRPCLATIKETEKENVWKAELYGHVVPDMERLTRHFYTSSSCGVCGKSSIEAVEATGCTRIAQQMEPVAPEVLHALPARLRLAQDVFRSTGGLHASAIYDAAGNLEYLREDVGRHNALDKLIGKALLANRLPLHNKILLLSGRISFELVQKAARAGIEMIAAVGAPSSLAVELAEAMGITLAGFLRDGRFNIYTHPGRVALGAASLPGYKAAD